MLHHEPITLDIGGQKVPAYASTWRQELGPSGFAGVVRLTVEARYIPENSWARGRRKRQELIAFAKTGAPPALVDTLRLDPAEIALALLDGEASLNAWVDESPTYSATLAARDGRCVPRMQEQKPYQGDLSMSQFLNRKPRRPESLNDFADEVHRDNQHWWHDPATGEKLDRNMGEMLMLVVSEIAECMEGERKDLMDDHLPHRKMAEVELADAIIRIADIAGDKGPNLEHNFASDVNDIPLNKGQALLRIVKCVQAAHVQSHLIRSIKLARAALLIELYAKKHGYDLWGAVAEKREYNKHRADHKPEARLAANGKKF